MRYIFSFLLMAACLNTGHLAAQQRDTLFRAIEHMDSMLFNAFNSCDTIAAKQFFTKDLEFYHDKGGLTDYEENMRSIRIRCEQDFVVRRELVRESMEVFPIKSYGAIQIGSHKFFVKNKGEKERLDGTFRFVHVWRKEHGTWKIARVVSFDH